MSSITVQNGSTTTALNRFGGRQIGIPDDGEVVGCLNAIAKPEIGGRRGMTR